VPKQSKGSFQWCDYNQDKAPHQANVLQTKVKAGQRGKRLDQSTLKQIFTPLDFATINEPLTRVPRHSAQMANL